MGVYISSLNDIAQFITVLLIFLFVVLLAWVSTKWVSRLHQGNSSNKNIKVIETYPVSNNKLLAIIQVGRKYSLIAIGKDTITHVMDLTQEDLLEIPNQNNTAQSNVPVVFDDILNKLKKHKTKM